MMSRNETNDRNVNRRQFTKASVGFGAAGLMAMGAVDQLAAAERVASAGPFIKPGDVILFQGDSITDAGRTRGVAAANSQPALGSGYAWLAAAQMLVDSPTSDLKIFNRGISGNKVNQLAERWQADCLDVKPNVLSILIGVNDYWHKRNGDYPGTLETYDKDYRALLKRTQDALPEVRLILCEPFLLNAGPVDDSWKADFAGYRKAARAIADDFKARFVPFQPMFDDAVNVAPAAIWAGDGVHPTTSGAALMAHQWLKTADV